MIAFRGAFGEGNFGDDLLMLACHNIAAPFAERSGIPIAFVGRKPFSYQHQIIPTSATEGTLDQCRVTVLGGGTQFFGFRRPLGKRLVTSIRNRCFPKKPAQSNPATLIPKPSAALGIGIGPFIKNRAAEKWARSQLSQMGFVGVRDETSYQWCRVNQIPNVESGSDLCFLQSIRKLVDRVNTSAENDRSIGVIVRDWNYSTGTSFQKPLGKLVDQLRNQGYSVTYISFCSESDCDWLEQLSDAGESVLRWSPESDSIEAFLQKLSSFSGFLTARFHGAVFAALLNRPSVCIEIEPKLKRATEMLGPACQLWSAPFSVSEGVSTINDTLSSFSKTKSKLAEAVDRQTVATDKMVRAFQEYIEESFTP